MASLLDPRAKGGVGIPNQDKDFLFMKIKEAMTAISRELDDRGRARANAQHKED
jgi:hypothetical protein